MRLVAAVAALAALLNAGIELAVAQDGSGQLITRGFVPLPSPVVVNVEPDDNTRTNMSLADRLSRELARRGYEVPSTAAPLVLRFDSEIRSNVTTARGRYQREPSGAANSDMSIGAAGPPDQAVGVANILSSAPGRSVMGVRRQRRLQPPPALRRQCAHRGPQQRFGGLARPRKLQLGPLGCRTRSSRRWCRCWRPRSARRCATAASRSIRCRSWILGAGRGRRREPVN